MYAYILELYKFQTRFCNFELGDRSDKISSYEVVADLYLCGCNVSIEKSWVRIVSWLGYGPCDLVPESWQEWELCLFYETSRLALESTLSDIQWVVGAIFLGLKWWGVNMTTQPRLMPRLRMSGVIPQFHYMPAWCVQGKLYMSWLIQWGAFSQCSEVR